MCVAGRVERLLRAMRADRGEPAETVWPGASAVQAGMPPGASAAHCRGLLNRVFARNPERNAYDDQCRSDALEGKESGK